MTIQQQQIAATLSHLFQDAKHDYLKMMTGATKSIFRPMQPADFKDAYLSISREQGEYLVWLIKENNLRNIVEFGTSFGISTLFLAQGVLATGGTIITTELIESKAQRALANFDKAGVADRIEVRTGDALETLKDHKKPVDLLLLDGWKDLYLPLFRMLEPNFHAGTIVYVDNADMSDSRAFLQKVGESNKYNIEPKFQGKAALIKMTSK